VYILSAADGEDVDVPVVIGIVGDKVVVGVEEKLKGSLDGVGGGGGITLLPGVAVPVSGLIVPPVGIFNLSPTMRRLELSGVKLLAAMRSSSLTRYIWAMEPGNSPDATV